MVVCLVLWLTSWYVRLGVKITAASVGLYLGLQSFLLYFFFFDITPQVENCIGVASLPLGVAPNFVVNGQHYVVPMCVEEPSVIAAASGVAKLLASHGGFTASSTPNVMTAEVQLCDFARYNSSHTMIVVFPVVSLLFPIRGVLWLPAWSRWRLPLP